MNKTIRIKLFGLKLFTTNAVANKVVSDLHQLDLEKYNKVTVK